ncbi:MAG: BtaA family protein [Firmicutes bacterium]|nr:BtaA family protein [Bacillota bacterium]
MNTVNFEIRCSQDWQDADLLVEVLNIQETDTVLSAASAGDNAFALLAQNPAKVYAIDQNFGQIACCELRKAMYRQFPREKHLVFGGVVPGRMNRIAVFHELELPHAVGEYWSKKLGAIEAGFMTRGKAEKDFALFRERVLPLIHTRKRVVDLIAPKTQEERKLFYDKKWNNRRWQWMSHKFTSRFPFYTEHALTALDTSQNPYLHFILNGGYDTVFPFSLREENYDKIRYNLDKIEFRQASIEEFIAEYDSKINAFNLSDIFDYMTQEAIDALYIILVKKAAKGARLAYWSKLAPKSYSDALIKNVKLHSRFDDKSVTICEI